MKKDANDNVHPASLSVMHAPEGMVCIRGVCRAERMLLPPSQLRVVSKAHTVQDGGKALREERLALNSEATNQECQWHFRLRMKRAHASKEEMELFEKLVRIPKNQVVAGELYYNKIPKNSILRSVPREELFPVFMPKGVCPHEFKVNQSAEVGHIMFRQVRKARSLFDGLVAAEAVLRARHKTLSEKLLQVKSGAIYGSKTTAEATWEMQWPPATTSWVPSVASVMRESTFVAQQFPTPVQLPDAAASASAVGAAVQAFSVVQPATFSKSGLRMPSVTVTVRPEMMRVGKYEDACSCGRTCTVKVCCDHVTKVIESAFAVDRALYCKPWNTPNAWQQQIGLGWEPVNQQEIIEQCARLAASGETWNRTTCVCDHLD